MKIGIFQDLHANLPALKKSLEVFKKNHCEKIYHVGDLIGIGPHPREVFELATNTPNLIFIMGNHDYWYGRGLPKPRPAWMSVEELEHQEWNHQQLGKMGEEVVQSWKFMETYQIDKNRKITFMHYGYDEKTNWFKDHIQKPTRKDLDLMFEGINSEFIFYGHNHIPSDIQGNSRYVNLGSAGCNHVPEVRLGVLEITSKNLTLEKLIEEYDDEGLMEDFELRKVPARKFITNNFITREP